MSGLAPHPWDEIAARITPSAQTVEEAARLLDQKAAEELTEKIRYLTFRIDSEQDRINDIQEEIGQMEQELEQLIAQRDGTQAP